MTNIPNLSEDGSMIKFNQYEAGQSDRRPWGSWTVIEVGLRHTVKRIEVLPGKRLSLQFHHNRCEHWIVVAGSGEVSLNGITESVEVGSHLKIPEPTHHRITNTGTVVLIFIEVQIGDGLSEDDIVRLEDDFGRV